MSPRDHFDDFEERDSRENGEEALALIPSFLFDPMGVARRRWIWIALAALLGGVVTAAASALMIPTYRAKATVTIQSQQIPEDFVRTTVREDTISNVNAMVGKVLSRQRLTEMIEEFGLFPEAGPGLPASLLVDRVRSRITYGLAEGFSARNYPSSVIFEIGYESSSPELAAQVANHLADVFVEMSMERRASQARRTTSFLQNALEEAEIELREQSQRVTEFKQQHRGELPGELETNLRKLDLANQRRESIIGQIAEKENRLQTLTREPSSFETSENQAVLAELRRKLAQSLAAFTEEHPDVIALRRKVAELEVAVEREGARPIAPGSQLGMLIDAERFELGRLRGDLSQLEVQIADLSQRIDRTPAIGDRLSALTDTEHVLREKYLSARRKVEDAELAELLETANEGEQLSILDPARVPTSPVVPNWLIVFAGFGGTLAFAASVAVLLELLDPVVVDTRQLEKISDLPAIGGLPHFD